jgi:hypothetical protein
VKPFVLFASVLVCSSADTKEIRPCEDAGVGIASLVLPVTQNSRTFYNNRVAVFAIDMIEPAAGSMGVAIILPDVDDVSFGSSKCLVIKNFAFIDVVKVSSSYDKEGLLLSFPTQDFDFEKGKAAGPSKLFRIRVNLKSSSVAEVP